MDLNTPRNRYIAILAFIAVLILVVGWQVRPRKNSEAGLSQADLTRLARLSQKNNLDGMATFFAEVARQVNIGLVWVEGFRSGGLVWDASGRVLLALPSANPYQHGWLRGGDESELPLQAELFSDPLSFFLLKSPPELALASLRTAPAGALRQGDWLIRVWKTGPQSFEFEPGLFSAFQTIRCGELELQEIQGSLSRESRALGSGVFDLEGRLLGATVQCGKEPRVIALEGLRRAIDRGRAVDSQILFRYGFLPAELNESAKAYFGVTEGLWVREVWRDTLAWDLGVRPGDVVTALDNDSVRKLEDLAMMTVPMYRAEYGLSIRRGRASRRVVFPPGAGLSEEAPPSATQALAFEQPANGVEIRRVNAGSRAERAGLRAGDRVVSAGPQFGAARVDPALINAPGPSRLFVVAERGDKLLGLFLE
jgi:S1-C subfamily serine protease